MKIYIYKLFNSFILTQNNLTLKIIRENFATTIIIKSFFAFERSLERILDRNFIVIRILIQETYTIKLKKAKTTIRRLMSKRQKHKLIKNLCRKCASKCQ